MPPLQPPRPPHQQGEQISFPFGRPRPCPHRYHTLRWRPLRGVRGQHLGDYCSDCGAWLRWVAQDTGTLAYAPPRPRR
jgi:hypothetical protein